MRFHNVLIGICILAFFARSFDLNILEYQKLFEENNNLQTKVDMTYFLSQSFRRTCQGKSFSSLNEWQKVNKAMWNLDFIAWSKAEDFLEDINSDKGILFYGVWKYGDLEGEVYSRVINEK